MPSSLLLSCLDGAAAAEAVARRVLKLPQYGWARLQRQRASVLGSGFIFGVLGVCPSLRTFPWVLF